MRESPFAEFRWARGERGQKDGLREPLHISSELFRALRGRLPRDYVIVPQRTHMMAKASASNFEHVSGVDVIPIGCQLGKVSADAIWSLVPLQKPMDPFLMDGMD